MLKVEIWNLEFGIWSLEFGIFNLTYVACNSYNLLKLYL